MSQIQTVHSGLEVVLGTAAEAVVVPSPGPGV